MKLRVRRMSPEDLESIYRLYVEMEAQVPFQPRTRFTQFVRDLRVSRCYPDSEHYDPRAEIAMVAEVDGEVVAYADGCKNLEEQAFLRMVIGKPDHRQALCAVIRRVTRHLMRFEPQALIAFGSIIVPVFLGFSAGKLHASWAWLGQCLVDEGYEADGFGLRMYRPLTGRGTRPVALPQPPSVRVEEKNRFISNGLAHLDRRYVLRHMIPDIAICEGYFSGAFVTGSGYRYHFTMWVTSVPGHRRKGYARWLMRNALVTAHNAGAKGALLMTAVDNFRAQSLYLSEGFTSVENVCSFTFRGQT